MKCSYCSKESDRFYRFEDLIDSSCADCFIKQCFKLTKENSIKLKKTIYWLVFVLAAAATFMLISGAV